MPVDPSNVLSYGMKKGSTGQLISAKENSRAWFLLFNDGKAYSAYIMVLIGDPSYIAGDPSRMANNSYRKRDANFSGMLLYFTPKGQFIRSYKYVNGQQVTPSSSATSSATKQTQSTGKKTNEVAYVDCEDWYMAYYDNNGNFEYANYIYTVCTVLIDGGGESDPGNGSNPGVGSDPGNGGGAPSPPPSCAVTNAVTKQAVNQLPPDPTDPDDPQPIDPGYPDPTQGSTCTTTTQDVRDSLKDTCLRKTLDKILTTQNINNTIGTLINTVFNSNSRVNLTYDQSTTLPSTRLGSTDSPPVINIDANGDTTLNITVHLNVNVLPGASQELVAMTILHEGIHAYLDYMGIATSDALAQHVIMGTKYVNLLTNSVRAVFPTLSVGDANALVLYEMADINTSSPNAFSNLTSTYGLTPTQVSNTGNSYKNQTTGTKGC